MNRNYTFLDKLLIEVDQCLSAVLGSVQSKRPYPAAQVEPASLSPSESTHSAGFMRVDHTGEVCAQALYRGQLLVSRRAETRAMLSQACEEEKDHLAWTQQRLNELSSHRSYLNFYWYGQSFLIGVIAGALGDRWSMGFVEETEHQVSRHLTRHLRDLPEHDLASRKIVEQMREDEEHHGAQAAAHGASPLPNVIKWWMALQAKVMTTLAYYV